MPDITQRFDAVMKSRIEVQGNVLVNSKNIKHDDTKLKAMYSTIIKVNSLTNSTCTGTNCISYSGGGGVYWAGNNGLLINSSFINCLNRKYSYTIRY